MHTQSYTTQVILCTYVHVPEKSLEVLWQFSSASIARVHCDKQPHSGSETDFSSVKYEALLLVTDGILDAFDLHGYHRQHLH